MPGDAGDPYEESYAVCTEAILNMRTIKALVTEDFCMYQFDKQVRKVAASESKKTWKKGFAFGIGNCATLCPQIITFYAGSRMIDNGDLTAAEMFECMFCLVFGIIMA